MAEIFYLLYGALLGWILAANHPNPFLRDENYERVREAYLKKQANKPITKRNRILDYIVEKVNR